MLIVDEYDVLFSKSCKSARRDSSMSTNLFREQISRFHFTCGEDLKLFVEDSKIFSKKSLDSIIKKGKTLENFIFFSQHPNYRCAIHLKLRAVVSMYSRNELSS